jgi:hypothetical protein
MTALPAPAAWERPPGVPKLVDLRDPDYTDARREENERRRRDLIGHHDEISEATTSGL